MKFFSLLCMDSSFTLRRDQWFILTPRLSHIFGNIHCQTPTNPVESNLKIISVRMQWRGWCWRGWVGWNICKLMFRAAFWVLLLSKNITKDSINVHSACEWAACQDVPAKGSCKSATHECLFGDAVKARPRGLCYWALIPRWPLHSLCVRAELGIWR